MAWTVLDTVIDQIDSSLAAPAPEQGGALLGHASLARTVVRFLHDPDAEVSTVSYRCSTALAQGVQRLERGTGYRLLGIAHSHPGLVRPSRQDHNAFLETLTLNPWIGTLLVPIVTQLPVTDTHDTPTEHGKISWFEARRVSGGVEVREADVRVLPVGRDLRSLRDRVGVQFEPDSFVELDGVGYVMAESRDEAAPIDRLLFPVGYPWQGPIALMRTATEGERSPVSIPWDLAVPGADRLVASWNALVAATERRTPTDPDPRHAEARLDGLLHALSDASVLLVGAGSVGSFMAEVLARHGVGTITIVDPDDVSAPNLSRSVYEWDDVGSAKVEALARHIGRIRPDVVVHSVKSDVAALGADRLAALVEGSTLVIGAIDDMTAQGTLNSFAWASQTPAIFPAIYREARAGEVCLSVPRPGGVCWRCAVLGAVAATEGERPHDYGTGRIAAATALGADVWTVSAVAAKLALAMLHLSLGGDGPLARFVAQPLKWGTTLVQVATSPGWGAFDDWFADAPGQWAYQSVWMTPTGETACPVCGPEPTTPRVDTVLADEECDALLVMAADFLQYEGEDRGAGPDRGEVRARRTLAIDGREGFVRSQQEANGSD